jgi:hypothetical protein
MLTIQHLAPKPERLGRVLKCPPLPPQSTVDLPAIIEMFETVPPQALAQAWLEKEEDHFAPGFVRAGWRGNSLLVFAQLIDRDIFNLATGHNQRAWELGDSFEIFLQPAGHSAYVEFQITPDNLRVQLRFADAQALDHLRNNRSIESVLMHGEMFHSRTWQTSAQCWYVYAEIKAVNLGDEAGPLHGRQWLYSFSRYDYTRRREMPVISSTSPHAEPDFHRRQEWGIMNFDALMPVANR